MIRKLNPSIIVRLVSAVCAVASLALWTACSPGENVDTSDSVYYSSVSEICPGTDFNITPSYHGTVPTGFAIEAVRYNGLPCSMSCFTVDPQSGIFSISNSSDAATGTYSVDVSCSFGSVPKTFTDAVVIEIMKPVPVGITAEPSRIKVDMAEIMNTTDTLPTARISAIGDTHLEIKKYLISNVYKNGEPAARYKEWFAVSNDGLVTVVAGNKDIEPGVYTIDFKLTTYASGADSEDGIFRKALAFDVTSRPLSISFSPSSVKVEKGYASKSSIPVLEGSISDLKYFITSVKPDNSLGITVDENSGVIRFPETSASQAGQSFTVSLSVSNEYGKADFPDAFTFNVIDYITPISDFSYDDVPEVISGVKFTNNVASLVGDEVTYSFTDLPSELSLLKIDAVTGAVSCEKGEEIAPGSYKVGVLAHNAKNDVTASFNLKVVANPYKFTYVRWGNNLGLTPVERYGNQFRICLGEADKTFPVLESDIPQGVPVNFKLVNVTQLSTCPSGATVNSSNGTITLAAKADFDPSTASARTQLCYITVTVGGTSDAAVSKNFPLFIDQSGPRDGAIIKYTPFAIRVNPKTGGVFDAPEVTDEAGNTIPGFTLDFRRAFRFYDAETYALTQVAKGTPLYPVWEKYFTGIGKSVNTGAMAPMSYWGDNNYSKGFLGLTGAYIDPADLRLHVNPEKFCSDEGYANGYLWAQFSQGRNGNSPLATDVYCYPLILWFDPTYTE